MVFTDHEAIRGIVNAINLHSMSIDRTNRGFVNASVYLFIYPLDIYYILDRFNLILNIFSRLQVIENDIIWMDGETEPILDTVWDEIINKKSENVFFINFEI